MRSVAAVVLAAGMTSSGFAATVTIEVRDYAFTPSDVTIARGDKVEWVWVEGVHTTTSDDELWDSGIRFGGEESFFYTFEGSGTYRYYCQPHGGKNGIGMSGIIRVVDPPPVPAGLTATALSSASVALSWTASSGAGEYEVWRATNRFGAYQLALRTFSTSATDTGRSSNTTYLYKVRALRDGVPSDFGAVDPATTIVFTDAVLAGLSVRAVHISELRTAANAYRAAANLSQFPFSDDPLSAGMAIRAAHVSELRSAVNDARQALGLTAVFYEDSPLAAGDTEVRAVHAEQLRLGIR